MARENSEASPEDSRFREDLAGSFASGLDGFSSDLNFLKRPMETKTKTGSEGQGKPEAREKASLTKAEPRWKVPSSRRL